MIEQDFQRLESKPDPKAARIEHRIEAGAPVGIVLAIAYPGRTRLLVLEAERRHIAGLADLEETRGLSIQLVHRRGTGDRDAAIEIAATDARFNGIFAVLASDVTAAIMSRTSEKDAAQSALARLAHWRRFFERARPEGMSREAQRGLYGELLFLRDSLAPVVGMGSAVRAWRGPVREVQDFVVNGGAVEVKTTAGRGNQELVVHSEHQLDDRGLKFLFLYHLSVDAREGIGETLPELIDHISKSCAEDHEARVRLDDLLADVGYIDAQRSHYIDGYVLRGEYLYRVEGALPRIVESELRPGVSRVAYAIAVAACRPYEVPIGQLAAVIGSSAGSP